jgi:sirohydrochlorin cobaltochelatase
MEEPPLVSDWRKLTRTRYVVVVPFFISDGLHSYEDIPRLLGIKERRLPSRRKPPDARLGSRPSLKEIFRCNPYNIEGRSLFYAPSIGTDAGFADIILEQAFTAKS